MADLLPRRRQEVAGNDQAEHHQDFLVPGLRQSRPQVGRPVWCPGLRKWGGTRERRWWDMVTLLSVRRGVPGTIVPVAAAQLC
jgi:hypothetical protein